MAFVAESIGKLSNWMMPQSRKKYIYGLSEGSLQDEAFLSRKAANLCELHRLGYSIPPAFIISSFVSDEYHKSEGRKLSEPILEDIKAAVDSLGKSFGHAFGSTSGVPPLLLSVRGGALVNPNTDVSFEEASVDSVNTDIVDILGAPDSWCIPGVKESCLGVGMNDRVAEHLSNIANPFIAYNTYAHFLVRFGTIVLGAPRRHYRRVLTEHVQSTGRAGVNLTKEDLMRIVEQFKLIADVPEDPFTQLQMTILEMYRCWFSPSAVSFRSEAMNVARSTGTAVIVQSIVFGGTGVCFTRSPVTGEQGQGVFGTYWAKTGEKLAMTEDFQQRDAAAYKKLAETSKNLELNFKDMQQYEFVYNNEDNVLYILQVQAGRRTPKASMKIAVDMVAQRLLTEREALLRLDASKASYFMMRHLQPDQLDNIQPIGECASAAFFIIFIKSARAKQ
jgi:pyruvate,orthophosphate dikinase